MGGLGVRLLLCGVVVGCGVETPTSDMSASVVENSTRLRASEFAVRIPVLKNNLGPPGQLEFVSLPVLRPSSIAVHASAGGPQVEHRPNARAFVQPPRNLAEPTVLRDVASGVEISFSHVGAANNEAEVDPQGLIAWKNAIGGDGDVVARVTEDGIEDYVLVNTPFTGSEISYDVKLSSGVAGVRSVAETVEFLDSFGVPRLRVSAPYVVDSKQNVVSGKLVVAGCDVDTDPVPSEGRPFQHVAGDSCRIVVGWDAQHLSYPLLIDPYWGSTGVMVSPRFAHGCLNPRGLAYSKMVCAGGINNVGAYLASAEMYSSSTNTWAVTGSMATPRAWFADAPSIDYSSNGRYFVAGGLTTGSVPTATTAEFTVSSGTWTTKASMSTARVIPAASGLGSSKILVSGGWNAASYLASTEVFNSSSNTWTPGPTMFLPRAYHTSTKDLSNNAVIVGGHNGVQVSNATEYYITASNQLAIGAGPPVPVYSHTATLIGAGPKLGKVYIGGGETGSGPTDALQRWEWSYWASDGHVGVTREWHVAFLMGDSQSIMFAGGWWAYGSLANAFVRDSASGPGGTWTNMAQERMYFAGGLVRFDSLGISKPVMAGGWNTQQSAVLQTAEAYTP